MDDGHRNRLLYGNPYYSMLRAPDQTLLYNEWGRSGYRRTLCNYPHFIDAKSGNIIVSERDNHRLSFFDNVGNECRFEPFGSKGHGQNQFYHPGGVTTTSEPQAAVIVADTGNRRVVLFSISSDHYGYGQLQQNYTFGNQVFEEPLGCEYDYRRGLLVVSDASTRRVSMHDLRTGQCIGEFRPPKECPLLCPVDLCTDEHGLWYVTDANGHCIHVYERNGDFIGKFGRCGKGDGDLNKPWGICFDREFNLLVSDEGNSRIVLYRTLEGGRVAGSFKRVVTNEVYTPKGLSINAHENLVVADGSAHNFLKIFKFK